MRLIVWILSLAVVAVLPLATSSCDRVSKSARVWAKPTPTPSPAPTPDDVAIARNALNVEDIVVMLESGDSQETIIRAVKERRITQKIVEAQELRLSLAGARRHLLQELRDPKNVLTHAQEMAYGAVHHRPSPRPSAR